MSLASKSAVHLDSGHVPQLTDVVEQPTTAAQQLVVDIGCTFARITSAAADEMFLDDETSPTDSMASSTTGSSTAAAGGAAAESDEIISKRNKKKINDAIKGLGIDDDIDVDDDDNTAVSAFDDDLNMLNNLLTSPCSPTHASHSLSLSDEGRDFLIDDEIADQPALCFSKNHGIIRH